MVWWWLQITGLMRRRARLTTTTTAITSNIIGIAIIIHYPSLLLTTVIRCHWKTTHHQSVSPSPRPPRRSRRPASTSAASRTSGNRDYYGSTIGSTVTGVPSAAERYRTSAPCGRTWISTIPETRPPVPSPPAPKPSPIPTVSEITCDSSIRCSGIRLRL